MSIKQTIKVKTFTGSGSINFEEDRKESLGEVNNAKALSDQVTKLQSLEDEIDEQEKKLKELKRNQELLSGEVIPTMMTEMNISTLKLADGSAVEVKPVYGASIPAAKKEDAFTWLRKNGLGDLIKNEVTVAFGRNEDNKALAYASLAQGQGYEPVQKLKVEPMTLKALVRERLESGQEMPSDLFNVFAGNRTKITRSK
jgi:alanyl-tRNA synthetase